MITELKKVLSQRSRSARARLFHKALRPAQSAAILDLGGGKGRHMARFYPQLKNVHIADYNPDALAFAREQFGFNTHLIGEAERLPFENNEFDIVFCSSVIEHVTGPKSEAVERFKIDGEAFRTEAKEYQRKFAAEVMRVGKAYFVQTPNRYFLVEAHSWLPLLGLLPTHWQWKIMRITNRFWPRKDDQPDWSLLSRKDLRDLFPNATIYTERTFGFAKSYIAIGKPQ
jgi:hypothetical protein